MHLRTEGIKPSGQSTFSKMGETGVDNNFNSYCRARDSFIENIFLKENIMDWIMDRVKEPSTWAGVAVGCVVIAMMTQWGWVGFVGAAAAVGAVLLKEKII